MSAIGEAPEGGHADAPMSLRPDLYEANSAEWIEQRGRTLMEEVWLDRLTAGLPPGGSVLDLGSGSGWPIAAELIRRGFLLTGVDASPSLTRSAKGSLPNGTWLVGDMRTITFPSRFDGVLAWHSFFHLAPSDQRRMFARFADLCAAGGMLMFTSGSSAGVAIGHWKGQPLYHASLDAAEYRGLLDASGFAELLHVADDPECGGATVWLCQRA